jgi:hypothetical protein
MINTKEQINTHSINEEEIPLTEEEIKRHEAINYLADILIDAFLAHKKRQNQMHK